MPQNINYYSLFAIRQGDRFISNFFQGVITVRTIDNGIATIDFDNDKEKHRNGEVWKISDIERELAGEDLHRLISRQFRRRFSDGSFTRGHSYWEDMAEKGTWDFVSRFLPNYERRDEVMWSDDLACVLDENHDYKDLAWLYDNYPEWSGLSVEELNKIRAQLDYELTQESEASLIAAIQSGEIDYREFPVTMVSAKTTGKEIYLECLDHNLHKYKKITKLGSADLQNVKSRKIDGEFHIFYESINGSGEPYWCRTSILNFQ